MYNRLRIIALFPLFLLIPILTTAQDKKSGLSVDLTMKPRAEFRNGSFTLKEPEDEPAFFVSQRTRLRLSFGISKLKIGVAGQNIRVWGASGQITTEEGNNTMLNEVWAEYEVVKKLSLRLGRQGLVYDDERILGGLDWNQAGRWHDLALIKFEPESHRLHAGLAYSQDQENKLNNFYSAPGNNYKTMQMIWYEHLINGAYKFSVLFLNTGYQVQSDSSMAYLQTFGGNFYRSAEPLSFTGTFYYQRGENLIKERVKAFMISLYGNYQFNDFWGIHIGTDFLSGTDMDDTDSNKTSEFIPLYGTNHKFYGLMDYFYVGVPHGRVGLWDKYVGTTWMVSPDFSLKLTGHFFNSGARVVVNDLGGGTDGTGPSLKSR